jgi:hypothetical protein
MTHNKMLKPTFVYCSKCLYVKQRTEYKIQTADCPIQNRWNLITWRHGILNKLYLGDSRHGNACSMNGEGQERRKDILLGDLFENNYMKVWYGAGRITLIWILEKDVMPKVAGRNWFRICSQEGFCLTHTKMSGFASKLFDWLDSHLVGYLAS